MSFSWGPVAEHHCYSGFLVEFTATVVVKRTTQKKVLSKTAFPLS